MSQQVSSNGLKWVTGIAIASLLAAFALLLMPGDRVVRSAEPDSFSRSAVGHNGLVHLLRDLGETVVQRRATRARPCGLIVLAEPESVLDDEELERVTDMFDYAYNALVVLPKRVGYSDNKKPQWIDGSELLDLARVRSVANNLPLGPRDDLSVHRVDAVSAWQSRIGGAKPVIAGPVQLIDRGARIEPLIECREGVLLGFVNDICVLSDPDLIANHGLVRGRNAELAVAILRHLHEEDGGPIVFDETLHGHAQEPSIFTLAGSFPAVLISAHLLLFCAVLAFAARGRFGAAIEPPNAIASGKGFLIDNVAALLRRAGHHGHALRRYGRLRVRHALERMHAPPGMDDEQAVTWLLSHIRDPAVADELEQLLAARSSSMSPQQVVRQARRLRELTERIHHAS